MATKKSTPKFLRISSNGFVPLFDSAQTAAYKLLESTLQELAKGTFHEDVGPDMSLKGKSVADFIAMIANEEVAFLESTADKASLGLELNYFDDDCPSVLRLSNSKIFVCPPVIKPQLEGKKLLLELDMRLELKIMLRPAECAQFLNSIKKKTVVGLSWCFRASETLDPAGDSCHMFQQNAKLFCFDMHENKKSLLAAD